MINRDWFGLTNMQIRTITVLTMGPLCILVVTWSKSSATFLVLTCLFIGGIEWSGLKRHLKVALLAPNEFLNGTVPIKLEGVHHRKLSKGDHSVERGINYNGSDSSPCSSMCLSPLMSLPDDIPFVPKEYAVPVSPLSVYSIFKYLGWSLLALAASYCEVAYITVLALYMLIFVCVTLMAQTRLEDRMEWAVKRLTSQFCPRTIDPKGSDPSFYLEKAYNEAQQRYFLSLELHAIAEKQPAEQFLDICLDLFGVMWLSGLVYFLFLYDMPRLGLPWSASVLISNFFNDITALLVGKGLWTLRTKYNHLHDCVSSIDSSECHSYKEASTKCKSGKQGGDNREKSRSDSSFFVRYILSSPHSLCPAISPNKSIEGAVSGVIVNAISFTASLYICYRFIVDYPDASVMSPKFQSISLWFVLGICVGVAGVLGDLLQSLLKRVARVKDSGIIIPGHGGILDRIDGILLVFPFIYCVVSVLRMFS
ncbi:unnamed protein product [Phytomonas sp. EM1]|nr:unnamed protein product [Phytomonas sp. EM1]|eukprot:CCW60358.1 unnamed protein product [Phytomonas sp. isolate EM1]